ncbi:MAG: WG repeat-containing protein [Bacteroidales bacterium]|nr:WG repeat-containing protein [Bacteroidales bacterium]
MRQLYTNTKACLHTALFIIIFMIGTKQTGMSQEKLFSPVSIGQHIDPNGVKNEILTNVGEVFFLDKDSRGKINHEAYQTLLSKRDAWMEEQRQEYLDRFTPDPLFNVDVEAPVDVVVKEFSGDKVRVNIVFTIGHSRWHHYHLLLKDYWIDRNETVDQIFRLNHLEEVYTATYLDIGHGSSFPEVLRALGLNYREYMGQSPQYRHLWFPDHNLEVVIQDGIVKYVQNWKPAWVDQLESGSQSEGEEENPDVIFPYDNFDVRYIPELGFAAVDKHGNFLFEVFPFDNGPDYPSEGLIRIRENGKIGYADLEGNVVIAPSFECAYPFQDGVALICAEGILEQDGEHTLWKEARWGAIDKSGKIIVEPFDLGLFTFPILDLKLYLFRHFAGEIEAKTHWGKLDRVNLFLHGEGEGLFVDLVSRSTSKLFLTYLYLPWQDLTFRTTSDHDARIPTEQLVTVTPKSVVYLVDMAPMLSEGEMDTITDLANMMHQLLEYEETQKLIREEDGVTSPGGMQIISLKEYPFYMEVSVATPGTGFLSPDDVRMEFPRKMILLHQVPDRGAISTNWIKPGPPEDYPDELFPDYQPKDTPDTMLDYMPSLLGDLAQIPPSNLSNLSNLIALYNQFKKQTKLHPGEWVDGNLVLGAREKEYRPSSAELMLMEIGERIGTIVSETDPETLKAKLKSVDHSPEKITFTRFFFIHYDVMGSGRFFYIDGMEEVSMNLF